MKHLLVLFTFLSLTARAQNLLMDGGFEDCNPDFNCDWKVIAGTPDFFGNGFDTLYNKYMINDGNKAHSGNCYLGCLMGYKSEFIMGKLWDRLEAGKEYYIEMYVQKSSHADQHGILREISVQFAKAIPDFSPKWRTINEQFIPLKSQSQWLNENKGWQLVSRKYSAKGGEQYLLLGNFAGANLDLTKGSSEEKAFYYYFDDVVVLPVLSPLTELKCNDITILEFINFQTGSAVLFPGSYAQLNQLVAELKLNPSICIEIRGHTDNNGDEEANLILSKHRAKIVFDYLIQNGISSNRLAHEGFGETKPIAENKTEEGRSRNRRVE
ncbi:MAG: OmpA family protein, partial [Saprospiraceae bacterium]|nr:OmpA family protein [Saprospiraceae bacterium]